MAKELERTVPKTTYTPRLRPDLVRALWQLKQEVQKPMTILLAEAVETYLAERTIHSDSGGGGDRNVQGS